ncbi:MAG: hypothetical protein AB8B55_15720 [Mariniblastus sp.]
MASTNFRPIQCLVFALMVISFSSLSAFPCVGQEIYITQKWTGKVADDSKRELAGNIVRDAAAWEKIWAAWRPDKKMVDVDFSKNLVLVETVNGPNNVLTSSLKIDATGSLKYETASTRMAGPGFGYLLMLVPSENIKAVNGVRLGQTRDAEMTKDPAIVTSNPTNVPAKPVVADREPTANVPAFESIKVDITGVVRTGLNSMGGESTGNLVAANGIVWELELTADQLATAKRLGGSMASIKGSLRKIRGIKSNERWIVTVESFKRVSGLANQAGQPARPMIDKEAANSKRIADLKKRMIRNRGEGKPERGVGLSNFKSITIKITGGIAGKEQRQTVSSDGTVNYEFKSQNISNSWQIDPEKLAGLHKFIAATNWQSVPAVTRSAAVPDAYQYEISIATTKQTRRFSIAGPAVAKQPAIAELFGYLRRPSR